MPNLTLYTDEELAKRKAKLPKSRSRSTKNKCCIYCKATEWLTSHHLIPVQYRRQTGLHPKNNKQIVLCRPHHSILHKNYSNVELAEIYNTWDKVIDALNKVIKIQPPNFI